MSNNKKNLRVAAQISGPLIDIIDHSQSLICQSAKGLSKIATVAPPIANIILGFMWIFSTPKALKKGHLTRLEAAAQLTIGLIVTTANLVALLLILTVSAFAAASVIGVATCFIAAFVSIYKYQKLKKSITDSENANVQEVLNHLSLMNIQSLSTKEFGENPEVLLRELIERNVLSKGDFIENIKKTIQDKNLSPKAKGNLNQFIDNNKINLNHIQHGFLAYRNEANRYQGYMNESIYQTILAAVSLTLAIGLFMSPMIAIGITGSVFIGLFMRKKYQQHQDKKNNPMLEKSFTNIQLKQKPIQGKQVMTNSPLKQFSSKIKKPNKKTQPPTLK